MTESPPSDRERAEDEAAAWLVLLSDAPDDAALRARFDAWHAADDRNAAAWARASRAYDLIGQAPPRHAADWAAYAAGRDTARPLPPARAVASPAARRPASGRPPAPRRAGWRLGAAAGAAIAAVVLAAVLPGVLLRLEADAATATAELRAVDLDDGTHVQLAPESAIDVAFAGGERRVRLLKGAAYFEVVPDPARPFRVIAGDTATTVLGTAFEVRRGAAGVAVAVRHGHVRVDDDSTAPPTSADLHDGQRLRVTWHGGAVRGAAPADEVGDWARGEFVARGRAAGDIVAALRPFYAGAIVVRDDGFAARRVSGIYDLRDPVKTLRDLAASHGARMRQVGPWLMVVDAE